MKTAVKKTRNKGRKPSFTSKSVGSFEGCIATSGGPIAYGTAPDGTPFYADPIDIERGFQFFTSYHLKIFSDYKDVPWRGLHYRARIVRPKFLGQLSDCARLHRLRGLLGSLLACGERQNAEALASVEGVIPERLLSTSTVDSFSPLSRL